MSYDISLRDPITHEEIEVDEPHFMRGGTYQTGGCQTLWVAMSASIFKLIVILKVLLLNSRTVPSP